MSESDTINQLEYPNTRHSIAKEISEAGITSGGSLLVHSSLSALGWVSGGAVAVIQALMDVITPEGTLVMPEHSGDLSDPANWHHPPVPENWWNIIRESMPAYNPAYTPSRGMGTIPEVFRTMPGVIRSDHPEVSFAAWGKHARFLTSDHSLAYSLGENSPLARIYDLDGKVLLMGVGFENNTSFHLSEVRSRGSKIAKQGAPIIVNGERKWVEYTDIVYDSDLFDQLGKDYSKTGLVKSFMIGMGNCFLFDQRSAVDFGVQWIERQRGFSPDHPSVIS
jgi:aminoglycoside 3-N-acetyltransferase